MVKLTPVPRPTALTDELVERLTQEFVNEGRNVWRGNGIEEALLAMSYDKCCYCECNITEESKYMEVEHFHHKDKYKDQVLLWSNLLPSCKRCNGTKKDHDVVLEPIINPAVDDPKDHLSFRNYRFYSKSDLGCKTIDVIDLNNHLRLVKKRFELGNELIEALNDLLKLSIEYDNGTSPSTRRRNRICSKMEKLLIETIPSSTYAATMATVLLNEDTYQQTKTIFINNNLWTDNFQALEDQARSCVLDLK